MTTIEAKTYLADKIAEALTYDARGDVVLRDQVVSGLLGDEFGLSLRVIRKALKEAGLIRADKECTRSDPEWDDDCGCAKCVEKRVYRVEG